MDGKTARGSYTNAEKSNAIHIVSAWVPEHGITLGQAEVDSKTNEITAIGHLLELMDLKNSIAAKIIEEKGDYILAIILNRFMKTAWSVSGVRSKSTQTKQPSWTVEVRYYLSSRSPRVSEFATSVHNHSLVD